MDLPSPFAEQVDTFRYPKVLVLNAREIMAPNSPGNAEVRRGAQRA